MPLEPFVSAAEQTETGLTIHTASQSPSFVRSRSASARLAGEQGAGEGAVSRRRFWRQALHQARGAGGGADPAHAAAGEDLAHHGGAVLHADQACRDLPHQERGEGWPITGRECEVFWNGGAYADIGPRITQKSGFTAPGPYDIDNISIDSYSLYTNLTPAGALRGFGIPQLVWAYESHTDMMARALKLDPIEFRRKNILRDGRPQATGTAMKDAAIEAVLDRLALRMNWTQEFERGEGPVKRGRGIAIGFKASISPTTSIAIVNVAADGSVTLYCSTVDMGQGSDTANAQLVAEVLNILAERVKVVHPDTDVTPYDMATLGSRSLYHMGHAVRLAAEDAKSKLAALAREVGLPDGSNVPIAEIFQKKYKMQAGNIIGTGSYIPNYVPPDANGLTPEATPFWMVGGAGCEVEVDTETGHVRVLKLINVADVGRPVNPRIVETHCRARP